MRQPPGEVGHVTDHVLSIVISTESCDHHHICVLKYIAESLRKNLSQPAGLVMEREEEGQAEEEGEQEKNYQLDKFHSESGTAHSILTAQVGSVLLCRKICTLHCTAHGAECEW